MCRLYGQISPTPAAAGDYLVEAERSLLAQGDARARDKQKDGWGLGWFIGGDARVVKSARPVFNDESRFRRLAARARSHVVIGHLRAASNPKGLVRRRLVRAANSQPFTDGRIVFAHNGTLFIHDEVAEALGPLRRRIRGENDSEVYFWQFIKHLKALGNIPDALEACVREDWSLWKACRARHPSRKRPYTGLNTLVSDGRSLHALCHYDPAGKLKSLFAPHKPWGQMGLARRGGRVLLASEDMDQADWIRLSDAEIVSATLREGRLSVRRRRFKPGG